MIDQIWTSIQQAATGLADTMGDNTRERTNKIIEDWLAIFPQLEIYGLAINSFSLGVAISPSIQAELVGRHEDWTFARIEELLAKHRGQTAITTVLTTIRTAYRLHQKTLANLRDPLILKISVKISPEVRVVIGRPLLDN